MDKANIYTTNKSCLFTHYIKGEYNWYQLIKTVKPVNIKAAEEANLPRI